MRHEQDAKIDLRTDFPLTQNADEPPKIARASAFPKSPVAGTADPCEESDPYYSIIRTRGT